MSRFRQNTTTTHLDTTPTEPGRHRTLSVTDRGLALVMTSADDHCLDTIDA